MKSLSAKKISLRSSIISLAGFDRSKIVLHSRRQHAVGQGGFHSGLLESGTSDVMLLQTVNTVNIFSSKPFQYVYDCGSRKLSACQKAIHKFVKGNSTKVLDLLFLSHFDDDHVNGVPNLLDKQAGLKVNTVVMPWVDDVERMIVWGKTTASRRTPTDFFEALVIDPVRTLRTFDPERIIFVRAVDDDPGEAEPIDIGPIVPGGEGLFRAKLITIGRDGTVERAFGKVEGSWRERTFVVGSRSVVDLGIAGAQLSWLFKPYVSRTDPAIVAKFERAAEKGLGWAYGSFRTQVADDKVRADLVRDATNSAALAAAYKSAVGNRNLTSLCLYSGPQMTSGLHGPMVRLSPNGCVMAAKIGWLGSGDISLAAAKESRRFLAHYESELDAVTSFSLPHHGAKPNHSMHVLSVLAPNICYASAKPPSNWKHPHPDVFADVKKIGAKAMQISDREITSFAEAFAIIG